MQKTLILAVVFILFLTDILSAQMLKGRVTDYHNQAIPYVSIFIKELTMGTATNENGEFEIKLPAGTYSCSFQHLSYETEIKTITIPNNDDIVVKLADRVYDLPMVTVGKKNEDPAYDMMRKAIGMAPFYMNQLSKYNADVYIKGTMVVEKISGLVKSVAGKEIKESEIKVGDKYLQESMSEITYDNGKYHQVIKSLSNTFPSNFNIELGMANYNIYNTENRGGMVSPVSPQAFSHYNFKYEGFSVEGKYIINRIKVMPKRENAMTFEGYLYLSDGYWNVHRFELSNKQMGIDITNRQSYGELEDNVWMPISNNIEVHASIFGNKASASYVSSIKYNTYVVNPLSQEGFTSQQRIANDTVSKITAPVVEPLVSDKSLKIAEQIQELMNKPNMNNRDAFKVSRLMRKKGKEDTKLLPDSLRLSDPLDLTDRYKIEVDSTAKNKDSLYWSEIRPVPLMGDELKSYARRDSIKARENLPDSLKAKHSFGRVLLNMMVWNSYKIESTTRFYHDGLLDPFALNLNLVDGLNYKIGMGVNKQLRNERRIGFGVDAQYAFKRKRFMLRGNFSYTYLPEKHGRLTISGGVKTEDFNYSSGLPALDNMLTTLLFRKNYINYFENRYLTISNRIEVANAFNTTLALTYSDRKQLHNVSDYSFFYKNKRDFRPNIPVQNPYVATDPNLVGNYTATVVSVGLNYTPKMYYRRNGKAKQYVRSDYPTFSLLYRKGIKGIFNSNSDFDQLEFSLYQNINMGALTSFRYNASFGWFPNNNSMHFADFKHFNIKEFDLLFSSFERSFNLIKSYTPATNEWYATISAQYSTPYLLLKHLPLLNRTMMQEKLYLSYLTTPYVKNYTQLGYGLTNIGVIGSIGAFVGFEKFQYSDWGVRFVINLSDF